MRMKNRKHLVLYLAFACLYISCHQENHKELIHPSIDFDAIHSVGEESSDYTQVLLRMSLKGYQSDLLKFGLASTQQHQDRLHYYINDFKNEIRLVANNDTLNCIDAHFERLHMDLPYRNFILTFNQRTINVEDYLLINDVIYTNQQLSIRIRKNYEN